MSTKQAKRWLGVAVMWLVIFGGLAVLGKHWPNGKGGGGDPPPPPPDPEWVEVFRVTIRFSPGTAMMRPFCEADIETLANKLNANPQYRVRTIGHISPGSTPEEELQLARDQVKEVRRRLRDKGVSETRILSETSTKPDENGAFGVVTCIVEKKKSDSDETALCKFGHNTNIVYLCFYSTIWLCSST